MHGTSTPDNELQTPRLFLLVFILVILQIRNHFAFVNQYLFGLCYLLFVVDFNFSLLFLKIAFFLMYVLHGCCIGGLSYTKSFILYFPLNGLLCYLVCQLDRSQDIPRTDEYQLKNFLHQIGLKVCLWDIFFIVD